MPMLFPQTYMCNMHVDICGLLISLIGLVVGSRTRHRGVLGSIPATARKPAMERGAEEREQVLMQRVMKRMKHRRLANAAHTRRGQRASLSALCPVHQPVS